MLRGSGERRRGDPLLDQGALERPDQRKRRETPLCNVRGADGLATRARMGSRCGASQPQICPPSLRLQDSSSALIAASSSWASGVCRPLPQREREREREVFSQVGWGLLRVPLGWAEEEMYLLNTPAAADTPRESPKSLPQRSGAGVTQRASRGRFTDASRMPANSSLRQLKGAAFCQHAFGKTLLRVGAVLCRIYHFVTPESRKQVIRCSGFPVKQVSWRLAVPVSRKISLSLGVHRVIRTRH